MIWLNPWALTALAFLAVPVLIHLLARRSARVQRFPTLRFIERSQLTAVRRTRISDLPLLIVRLGILGAAVLAVARPVLLTVDRERDLGGALARAIIVDSSASMRRGDVSGATGALAIDRARREAARLAAEARTSVRLETTAPRAILAGASAWLATQPGRRELVVISDFQRGALDSIDVEAVPPGVGVRLERVQTTPAQTPADIPVHAASGGVIARVTAASDRTDVEWIAGGVAAGEDADGLLLLAAVADRPAADAARAAARTVSPGRTPPARPVAIIYPSFETRATIARDAQPLRQPWQGDLVAALRRDPALAGASAAAEPRTDGGLDWMRPDSPFVVVARNTGGQATAVAAGGRLPADGDARDRLLVFSLTDPGTVASAALIAAIAQATATPVDVAELEPATIPPNVLAGWQREAAPAVASAARGRTEWSDGRWLWALAVGLLILETWLRRTRRERSAPEVARARAA